MESQPKAIVGRAPGLSSSSGSACAARGCRVQRGETQGAGAPEPHPVGAVGRPEVLDQDLSRLVLQLLQ